MVCELQRLEVGIIEFVWFLGHESKLFCAFYWGKCVINLEMMSQWKMLIYKSSLTLNFLGIFENR